MIEVADVRRLEVKGHIWAQAPDKISDDYHHEIEAFVAKVGAETNLAWRVIYYIHAIKSQLRERRFFER